MFDKWQGLSKRLGCMGRGFEKWFGKRLLLAWEVAACLRGWCLLERLVLALTASWCRTPADSSTSKKATTFHPHPYTWNNPFSFCAEKPFKIWKGAKNCPKSSQKSYSLRMIQFSQKIWKHIFGQNFLTQSLFGRHVLGSSGYGVYHKQKNQQLDTSQSADVANSWITF